MIKLNKAITLIALIITIVVLLILAAVTINMVLGENGLFNKAKASVGKYENEKEKENATLANFEEYILQFTRSGEVTDDLVDAIVEKMYQKQVSIVPAGTVISCIRSSMPAGYLACDGSKYNVSDYPVLYAALKDLDHTGWAEANWTTEFTVPDLRGEFLRGTGTNGHTNQGNGATIGRHQNGTTIPNIISNQQGFIQICNDGQWRSISSYDNTIATSTKLITAQGSMSDYTEIASVGMIRPTNTSVLYCIKY